MGVKDGRAESKTKARTSRSDILGWHFLGFVNTIFQVVPTDN